MVVKAKAPAKVPARVPAKVLARLLAKDQAATGTNIAVASVMAVHTKDVKSRQSEVIKIATEIAAEIEAETAVEIVTEITSAIGIDLVTEIRVVTDVARALLPSIPNLQAKNRLMSVMRQT